MGVESYPGCSVGAVERQTRICSVPSSRQKAEPNSVDVSKPHVEHDAANYSTTQWVEGHIKIFRQSCVLLSCQSIYLLGQVAA
jgi:hypothetical protein